MRRSSRLKGRLGEDSGAGSLELVLVFPALLVLILAIVQFGLWYEAEHATISAAQEGAQAARLYGGNAAAGKRAASVFLHNVAPTLVERPAVSVSRSATTARATVTGAVESLLPGLRCLRDLVGASGGLPAVRRRDESGSAALELALLTPVLIVVLLFVVALGRVASARESVDGAAGAAARAATLASSPQAAVVAARAEATSSLSSGGTSCAVTKVAVDVADFVPGGVVSVRVSCEVTLSSAVPGLPGSSTISATGASVLDRYRSLSS